MAAERVYLVTGAFGGLALRVLRRLSEQPDARIVAIGRRRSDNRPALPHRVELIDGDLRDAAIWSGLPRAITHVLHLAAFIPWRREQKTAAAVVADNLVPLGHLLEHSHSWPALEQIVYASSVSVYGWTRDLVSEDSPKHPAELYGAVKLAGEDLLLAARACGIRVACLRYGSLFGGGQYPGTVIPAMIRAATQTGRICIHGEGNRSQDFLHYDDAAEAALLACRHAARGTFNVGSGEPVTMNELAALVREIFTAGKAELVHDREMSEGDPGFRIDIRKAARELEFTPRRGLHLGLAQLKHEMEHA